MTGSINFSGRVYKQVNKEKIKREIIQSMESSPEFRKEIRRVFQVANRRIQNIERAGILSPAVQALNKGDIKGFTKFAMRGSWEDLKLEYGKAVSFLRQPTSTAGGAREYANHIKKAYNLTDEDYRLMQANLLNRLTTLEDSEYVERYLFRYKDFTGEMEQEASDISAQLESDAESLSNAIQKDINKTAEKAAEAVESQLNAIEKSIMDALRKFGL